MQSLFLHKTRKWALVAYTVQKEIRKEYFCGENKSKRQSNDFVAQSNESQNNNQSFVRPMGEKSRFIQR